MTLDEKRDVIEVLLCGWQSGCSNAGWMIGASLKTSRRAVARRISAQPGWRTEGHEKWRFAAIEAAYRLIESSPTLIAEWFTKPREHDAVQRRFLEGASIGEIAFKHNTSPQKIEEALRRAFDRAAKAVR